MFRIKHQEHINGTRAIKLALKAWLELLEKGYSTNNLPIEDNPAIVAWFGEHPVGFISYNNEGDCLFIETGYILPEFRERGLYSDMFNALVRKATSLNISQIASWIEPINTKMVAIAKRQGRRVFPHNDMDGHTLLESVYDIPEEIK